MFIGFITNPFTITPILIGHRIKRNLRRFDPYNFHLNYNGRNINIIVESPRLYRYQIQNNDILLCPINNL